MTLARLNRLQLYPLLHTTLIKKHNGYSRDGQLFEKILAEIYSGNGFDTNITAGTNDGGVDIIAEKDGMRIAIQAKNYNDNMTKKNIRKSDIKQVFHKIKHIGESKYGAFTNARLHIYNNNIISYKPYFIEDVNNQFGFCLDDKGVYGQLWIKNQLDIINDDSYNKISKLIL
jgi:hypothetical protein